MKHRSIWLRIGQLWVLATVLVVLFSGWAHDDPPYRRAERVNARQEYKLHPSPATKAAFDSELNLKRSYEVRVVALWMGTLFLVATVCVYAYHFWHERKAS